MLGRNANARLNARLLEIPNCGHMPALLDAEQISIVSDWINARNNGLAAVQVDGVADASGRNARVHGPLPHRRRR
jgi:hypothetical protein